MRPVSCLACHGRGCDECESTGRDLCGVVPMWAPPQEYCARRRPCPVHDAARIVSTLHRPVIEGVRLGRIEVGA